MSPQHDPDPDNGSARNQPLVIFGEVLFDCFESGERRLGGAPFNVAWTLQAFGQAPFFVSVIGQDEDGAAILDRMQDWGMAEEGLRELADHATGTVEVRVDDDEPGYDIPSPRAWDFIEDEGFIAERLLYHGSLALRSDVNQGTLRAMRERSPAQRFFDVNLRPPHTPVQLARSWMRGADWVKLNLDELREVSGEASVDLAHSEAAIDHVIGQYAVNNVLLTAGAQGARIRGDYGDATVSPAPAPESLVDTVGAGDAFTAVTLHGILSGWSAGAIVERAGRFAAKVCGLKGAITRNPTFYQI